MAVKNSIPISMEDHLLFNLIITSRTNPQKPTPPLQRMLLCLQPYDCAIKYLPGREMVTAKALLRLLQLDKFEVPDMNVKVHHLIRITPAKMQEFQEKAAKDEVLQPYRSAGLARQCKGS